MSSLARSGREGGLLRVWYVSPERLCNLHCSYCVSTGDYAKSSTVEWASHEERAVFEDAVRWLGSASTRIGLRMGTLGEPFASKTFLERAAWLTTRGHIEFVELLTNGALLGRGLPRLLAQADSSKVSLWITHHPAEVSAGKLIENARLAQEVYGCFVVVNALLFPDNVESIMALRDMAVESGLRFNVDLGYNPRTPRGLVGSSGQMVPSLRLQDFQSVLDKVGANHRLVQINLRALEGVQSQPCRAGHSYVYIAINGDVYRCSRYYVLRRNKIGNVRDREFRLRPLSGPASPCEAAFGCCNKEDFLNLEAAAAIRDEGAPSLGWSR